MKNNKKKILIISVSVVIFICIAIICFAINFVKISDIVSIYNRLTGANGGIFVDSVVPKNLQELTLYDESSLTMQFDFPLECDEGYNYQVLIVGGKKDGVQSDIAMIQDKDNPDDIIYIGELGYIYGVDWVTGVSVVMNDGDQFFLAHIDESLGKFHNVRLGDYAAFEITSEDFNEYEHFDYDRLSTLDNNYSILPTKEKEQLWTLISEIGIQTSESLEIGSKNTSSDRQESHAAWYYKLEQFNPSIDISNEIIYIDVPHCTIDRY